MRDNGFWVRASAEPEAKGRHSVRVAVIGGGQLARMMIAPAVELGIEIDVLAETEGSPSALAASQVGDYRDADTVLAFARGADAVTFDHENVPQSVLAVLVDAGLAVHPKPEALRFAQDKIDMRRRLTELGVPSPDWAAVTTTAELDAFIAEHGGRAIVKTARGGYDGKGVRVVETAVQAEDWFARLDEDGLGGALLVEEFVPFRRELSQMAARTPSGVLASWTVVETVQREGVCAEVYAPAPDAAPEVLAEADRIARLVAEGIDITGAFAVELFETTDGRLLVNELAMRPHNSGHWTQDGARTSQFEQHLRAVLDLPLGDPAPTAPHTVMINVLGGPEGEGLGDRYTRALAVDAAAKVHSYNKQSRPGRKVGHVNLSGTDAEETRTRARAVAAVFQG